MAASPIIPNCVELRLLWTWAGQGAVNVLHAIAPAGFVVNQTTTNSLGTAIKASFGSTWGTVCANTTQLVRVTLRDKRIANAAEFLDTGAAALGTVVGAEPLPPQTALCITLRTAQSGKSFRGRVYLGGATEADNAAGGVISATGQTAAINFVTGIQTALTNNGSLQLAVATRAAEQTVVNATTTHTDGTTTVKRLYTVQAKAGNATPVTVIQSRGTNWETQRRRNNGRGALPTIFNAATEVHLPQP